MMDNEYLKGYKQAIEDLREIGEQIFHVKRWSHSRNLKFAPVELSDELVKKYWKLQEESKNE